MRDKEIFDKISGAEAAVAFAKIEKPNNASQTTRLNIESFSKAIDLLKTLQIREVFITIQEEGNLVLRLRKDSDIAIVVSPFASLDTIV